MEEEKPELQEKPNSDLKEDKKPTLILIGIIILLTSLIVAGVSYFAGSKKKEALKTEVAQIPTPTQELLPTQATEETQITTSATPSPTLKLTPTTTLTPQPQADLYISEYSFDHQPKQGEPFTVKVGIYNKGNKAAGNFWWEWWGTTSAPTYACRERIEGLAARGRKIVTCTYTYESLENYTTKAVVDADDEVPESDETNNIYEQKVTPLR